MLYTAYVWGILPDPELDLLLDSEEVEDICYSFDIKRQYESRIAWAGIEIDVHEDYRTAFKAKDAAAHIHEVCAPKVDAARKQWDGFAQEFTQITKVQLPSPDLLIVREYD